MKNLFFLGCLSFFFITTTAFSVYWMSWKISPDYVVKFEGKGAKGTFSNMEGTIIFEPTDLYESKMDVTVEVATIETGNDKKNTHARSEKWFDAEQFPKIRFSSKSFELVGANYNVVGDLEIKGISKEVIIPFTFTSEVGLGLFEGKIIVDRNDFGISGPWYSFTVADELVVELKVPVER